MLNGQAENSPSNGFPAGKIPPKPKIPSPENSPRKFPTWKNSTSQNPPPRKIPYRRIIPRKIRHRVELFLILYMSNGFKFKKNCVFCIMTQTSERKGLYRSERSLLRCKPQAARLTSTQVFMSQCLLACNSSELSEVRVSKLAPRFTFL